MVCLGSYSTLVFALSKLVIASPFLLRRQNVTIPGNVANGTDTAGCSAFHASAPGDTCITIEVEFNITDTLFRSLNPEINAGCTNLIAGQSYCVASAPTVINTPPIAPGTIVQGCTKFFTIGTNDSCSFIETQFNISDILFKIMNPEIDAACDNLIQGFAYCVETSNLTTIPSNVSPGTITSDCVRYLTIAESQSCTDVEAEEDITLANFLALNPQVDSECLDLVTGQAYCVATINTTLVTNAPNNVAPGTITMGCTEFFTVEPGQVCAEIEVMFDISPTLFLSLNPQLNVDCTNLVAGEAYCVQGTPPS